MTRRIDTTSLTASEPRWADARQLTRGQVPREVLCWLLDTASLTHRVRQACHGRFRVRVLSQGWGRVLQSEARALGLRRGARCIVRQVQLLCDERPWVFARTVIPARTLRGPQRRLAHLGSRPLGAVLFADPGMQRGAVEITCLRARHGLYAGAARDLVRRPAAIWGRRSVFRVGGKPLLVSEFFLPGIVKPC